MGELYERLRPQKMMDFSGERLTDAVHGQIEIEHLHRYFLTLDYCRDKDVLDIASGEGYGSALIAQVAKSVVGIDVDQQAVEHAIAAYPLSNLRFQVGDCRNIALPDHSCDIIVSFETIEHIREHEVFLAECKRVLRPGGTLIVSTPDSDVYSPDGRPANKFHRRELTECEFLALTEARFDNVALLRQRPIIGSVILSTVADGSRVSTIDRRGEDTFESNPGLARALYLLAWCSDGPIQPPSASVYVETSQIEARDAERDNEMNRLRDTLSGQANEVRRLEEVIQGYETREAEHANRHPSEELARDAERQKLQTEKSIEERLQSAVRDIGDEIAERINDLLNPPASTMQDARVHSANDSKLAQAHREIERLSTRLHAIEASTSWRALYPLHRALSGMPRARSAMRVGARVIWRTSTLPFRKRAAPAPQVALAETASPVELDTLDMTAARAVTVPPAAADPLALTPVQRRVQARAIGSLMPAQTQSVVVGIVTYNNDNALLRRLIGSAREAISRAGGNGHILLIDNGEPSTVDTDIDKVASAGNIGFGAAHNRLMKTAFETQGADIYIAANPDGIFHPDCIDALVRMHAAHGGQALVEACQFPVEHPKVFDPVTFETEWASGACLSIPRRLYEEIGGFDEAFFMYCEDVDYSWRARAHGYAVLINPSALFLHAVTNRDNGEATWQMMLKSGNILARKWGHTAFAGWTAQRLEECGEHPCSSDVAEVPTAWRGVANFSHNFSFSPVRW